MGIQQHMVQKWGWLKRSRFGERDDPLRRVANHGNSFISCWLGPHLDVFEYPSSGCGAGGHAGLTLGADGKG